MSEWITDRRPTEADSIGHCEQVYVMLDGVSTICHYLDVGPGDPWMHIVPPEPYVKPKRWWMIMTPDDHDWVKGPYAVYFYVGGLVADKIPTREAAERIGAIYEETCTTGIEEIDSATTERNKDVKQCR